MLYDLSNPLQREAFKTRCNFLFEKAGLVELTDKRIETDKQFNYLHVLLQYFALEYGETLDFVKYHFLKKLVCPDIFLAKKKDKILGEVEYVRSSKDLTLDEMSVVIDRFMMWSSKEAGIYLPPPQNTAEVAYMKSVISRGVRFL